MLHRISVSICVAGFAAGCGERNGPPPEAASPPAFVSPQPQPKDPRPDGRETKVMRLDSDECTASQVPLIDFTSAEVLARCESKGSTSRIVLTVLARTTDSADYLRALSLRFCGDVVGAEAPSGWKVEIEREKGRSALAADVLWELTDANPNSKTPVSRRTVEFAVTLRGQWRRGLGYSVVFSESGGVGSGSPHDCPYPFN